MDDGERDARGPDQAILQGLATKVVAVFQALRADDGQRHVVFHAGGEFRLQQVVDGRAEEVERGLVVIGR